MPPLAWNDKDEIQRVLPDGTEQPLAGRRTLAERTRELEAARAGLVGWLVEIGYPYDFATDPPIPASLRMPLAMAWFAKDGGPGETLDMWAYTVAEEGRWSWSPSTTGPA